MIGNSVVLHSLPMLNPRFITEDSKLRRIKYLNEIKRKVEEENYIGPKEEFLATLGMEFIISEAKEENLKRAEELTVRINQLSATGKTYNYDELDEFRKSENHKLYVCELIDKYGSYGKVGLALVEVADEHLYLKLLLMSCRVMSRGVGTIMLTYIMKQAKAQGKKVLADFIKTGRNKVMYVTYRFANFKELSNDGKGNIILQNNLSSVQEFPKYIKICS